MDSNEFFSIKFITFKESKKFAKLEQNLNVDASQNDTKVHDIVSVVQAFEVISSAAKRTTWINVRQREGSLIFNQYWDKSLQLW